MDTEEQHFEGELCVVPRKAESRSGSWTWPLPSSACSANRKSPPQAPANSMRGTCAAIARRSWPDSPRRKHRRRTLRTEASDSPKRQPAKWRAFSCPFGHGRDHDSGSRLPGRKHHHQRHGHDGCGDVHGPLGGEPVAGRRRGHLARGVGRRCVHGLKHGCRPGTPLSDKHRSGNQRKAGPGRRHWPMARWSERRMALQSLACASIWADSADQV